jgi:uncharacterized protein YecT (DUF1311 family)
MKNLNGILFALIATIVSIAAEPAIAQSQTAMNQQATSKFKKQDRELNKVYKQILNEYSADTVFIKNLRSSQKIWARFRDAEVNMRYPNIDYAGTATSMCKAQLMEEITKARIKTLRVWLTGITEGDVCSGTVKAKI